MQKKPTSYVKRIFRGGLLILISAALSLSSVNPAIALDPGRLYDHNGIDWFNLAAPEVEACNPNVTTENVTLTGNDNEAKAFNFFISHGLTAIQSASIVGNFIQESGVEPTRVELNGGPGRGIAQWSVNDRWAELKNHEAGKDPLELATQLDFVWFELTGSFLKSVLEPLKATTTVEPAVKIVNSKYEISADTPEMVNTRVKYANEVLTKYGGGAPAGAPVPVGGCQPSGGGAPGNVNTDGYAFPVEPQRKSQNSGVAGLSPLPCPGTTSCHHDNTPAFDIGRKPGEDASAGAAEYAIHDGTITNLHIYMGIDGCYSFQLKATDGWYYYYTHLSNPVVKEGQDVKAGQKTSEIGRRACTANGSLPHLHIDRGANHQSGGEVCCRDPDFVPLMNSIFNALPE